MRVELLGTGGYFANERRHTACVLLPELGIVLDAGSALFRFPPRCAVRDIHLFVTHAHLDHIVGLPFLLMPRLSGQYDEITLHATAQTLAAVQDHLFAQPVFPVPMPFACDKIPAAGSLELSSGARVSWTPLASHPGGSLAFRIDAPAAPGGKSIAYVTDTATDGSYAQLIQGVDLLIHECYFRDEQAHLAAKTGHSCASAVAQVAAQAQAKRLIIVHVDPTSPLEDPLGVPALRAIFPRVELGTDGLVVEV